MTREEALNCREYYLFLVGDRPCPSQVPKGETWRVYKAMTKEERREAMYG